MAEPTKTPEPLQDFSGQQSARVELLTEIDLLLEEYKGCEKRGEILPNLVEALRIELTYNSNAIEGNTLTLRQTQLAIEGTVPPGNQSMRELYEARNHDLALRMIEQWSADQRGALTQANMMQIHQRIMTDVAAHAGQFRTGRVLISGTGYVPPASRKFDQLIPGMLELAERSNLHPVILAAELHYNCVAIHPFADGNGRTARLLMDYHLLRAGFPHVIIAVSERAEYLAALDEANAGKVDRFARFVIQSVAQSIRRYLI